MSRSTAQTPRSAPPSVIQKIGSAIIMKKNSAAAKMTGAKVIGKTTSAKILEAEANSAIAYRVGTKYDIVRTLPPTGEGQVSFVQDRESRTILVRKVIRPVSVFDDNRCVWDKGKWKYPNEAIVARSMKPHPNILRMFLCTPDMDLSAPRGQYELFTEFCQGGDLDSQMEHFLDQPGRVPDKFILHATIELFDAMAFIHNGLRYCKHGQYTEDPEHKPIVHADIKPQNIFLKWNASRKASDFPTLVVGDFGGAKFAGGDHHVVHVGSEMWRAPEDVAILGDSQHEIMNSATWSRIIQTAKARDRPSDMYAIGLILESLVRNQIDALPIGHNFTDLDLPPSYRRGATPETYNYKPVLRRLIRSLLVVDPTARGRADFNPLTGLLDDVHLLRRIRQDMIDAGEWTLPRNIWKETPPPARHDNM